MSGMQAGLIQMNAQMIMTDGATTMVGIGIFVMIIALLMGSLMWTQGYRTITRILFAVAAVGILMAIIGARQPRVKEIRACASGPISLEQIAAKYEIVEVDGKELVLRER